MYKNYDMDVNYYVPALVLSRLCTLHRTHRARTSEPLSRQNETRRESDTALSRQNETYRCYSCSSWAYMYWKSSWNSYVFENSGNEPREN
jgi:hypothetical protein